MQKTWLFILLGFLALTPFSHKVAAQDIVVSAEMSAKNLLSICTSTEEMDIAQCAGYIQGLVDYHILTRSLGTAPSVDFCVPSDVPTESLVIVVRDYLTHNTQHQSFIAAPAVALALYDMFPCAK